MTKTFVFLSIAFLSTGAWAQSTLKSKALKQQICEKLNNDFYDFNQDACLASDFVFSAPVKKTNVNGKSVTTQMTVSTTLDGKTYEAVLNAQLVVDEEGNVTPAGWVVVSGELSEITDDALLKSTFTGSDNAAPVEYKSLSKKIKTAIDKFEDDERDFFGAAEDWEDGDREYYVVKNDDGDVIGYLVTDSWMSEELDIKIFFTLRFDTNGKYVDSVSESFNYHE